jgi:pimeloyl-ACP methyl ester carboxylesterase
LVHGAFHGGWCWRKLTPLLRAAGHEVYTPTLTGWGERRHLASPAIGLDTWVQDVVNVLEYEDLRDVVLVGHSMGGHVIVGVAEQAPERLAHLVYLDADSGVYAADGWSYLDVRNAARRDRGDEQVGPRGGPGGDVDWQALVERMLDGWEIVDPADRRWMAERLVSFPGKGGTDPLRLTSGRGQALPRTFILCTRGPWLSTTTGLHPVRTAPGWRLRELDTGHDAMVTASRECADLLLEVTNTGR